MPGRKKNTWSAVPLPGETEWHGEVPIIIPDHDPGRIIFVEFTKDQARAIGMALWTWGNE